MTDQVSTKWVSIGLLAVSVLALLVGVVTVVKTPEKSTKAPVASDGSESKLISALTEMAKEDHIMYINLSGPIVMQDDGDSIFGEDESNAVKARKALSEALEDDSVKGILLAINSPGGTVGMSQELNAAVKRVEKEKPVLAYMGDVAASGGYYTACAATKIMANPGTLTGSIGVIISTLNFKDLFENKLGIQSYTIKSGKFKDLMNPYRDVRPDELALIQELIDKSYIQFINAVLEGRTKYVDGEAEKKALSEKIRAIADGRILIGSEAKIAGLVDEIGDIDDAYNLVDRMAKERFKLKAKDRLPMEEYSESKTLLEYLGISTRKSLPLPQSGLGAGFDRMLPLSLQYPNQPLWVFE